jgi:spore coat protein JB
MQQGTTPKYSTNEAFARGTLFPGLNLPFMNVVNTAPVADTPLSELMAMHFVCDELKLYMDTHPKDTEAFELLKNMINMTKEAHKRYVEKYGPINFSDVAMSDSYTWPDDPWPWNYRGMED